MKKPGFILILLLVVCPITSTASALEVIAEARFESVQGKPLQEELRFSSQGYEEIVLAVQNGAENGADRVSSAVISLNGVKVLQPSDFSQKVANLQRVIVPHNLENVLSVSVRSKPDGYLVVQILGEPSLNLPPDPGPAGDEAIEGIDTDQNGVRDDIDRWIGLNYRNSEKTRMALMHAAGEMAVGETFTARSIIGSEFTCTIAGTTMVGDRPAIIPEISGRGWITGTHQHMLDPDDPWPEGYRLSDTWPSYGA